jgi:hypothetical protein
VESQPTCVSKRSAPESPACVGCAVDPRIRRGATVCVRARAPGAGVSAGRARAQERQRLQAHGSGPRTALPLRLLSGARVDAAAGPLERRAAHEVAAPLVGPLDAGRRAGARAPRGAGAGRGLWAYLFAAAARGGRSHAAARHPRGQARGRDCIVPELSRNHNIGAHGATVSESDFRQRLDRRAHPRPAAPRCPRVGQPPT